MEFRQLSPPVSSEKKRETMLRGVFLGAIYGSGVPAMLLGVASRLDWTIAWAFLLPSWPLLSLLSYFEGEDEIQVRNHKERGALRNTDYLSLDLIEQGL